MDADGFRRHGKEMVDYIADYLETLRERPVMASVQPGYMRHMLPDQAPHTPDTFQQIMDDVDRCIMPGITHWHHPNFHAYFPTANSYPAIVADMLSTSIACIGFTWASSPAYTELETVMMDWLAKALKLPDDFWFSGAKSGGGVIQGTASEATLFALMAARSRMIRKMKDTDPSIEQGDVLGKLVAYSSEQAHSSVERAGMLGAVRYRAIPTDELYAMRPETLAKAMQEDRDQGLIPFYVVATLGTTNSCAFDNLKEIGPICQQAGVWLHIDAAYAGSAFICPEFRPFLDGVELADSFNFNPHKWMLVNFDCSTMWVRNREDLVGAFTVDPLYLKHDKQADVMPDYRHWHIPLGRRFRSLKIWFVLRLYGIQGIQEHIRKQVQQAHEFEALVRSDERYEVVVPVVLGLVCFRIKGTNSVNERLMDAINKDGRIHMVPGHVREKYMLRFAVCATRTTSEDIKFAWRVITELSSRIMTSNKTSS